MLENVGITDTVKINADKVDLMKQLGPRAFLAKLGDYEVLLNMKAREPENNKNAQ
jgi:hypothetical protein